MLADAGVGEDDLAALVLTGGASRIPAVARGARGLAGRDTVVASATSAESIVTSKPSARSSAANKPLHS
jgi:molecular chaperone DnaK (HSP70)